MKYFDEVEFACHCCGVIKMDQGALAMIDRARDIAGVPFHINSGYRCPKHNKAVGSISMNHVSGKAFDVQAQDSRMRFRILYGAIKAGFNRIGIYPEFIHMDCMTEGVTTEVAWFTE